MKKVLIIAYYWTPAGGPGVQRWIKFVKYLRFYGIEPVVYVPENPYYPLQDSQMGTEIPTDITIVRKKIWEPYTLANFFSKKATKEISSGILPTKKKTWIEKFLLWIRANLFIPDARVNWVSPSVKFLSKYLTEQGIDTIITTAPPHSLHLIGLHLKQKLPQLYWIADFRDPWTTIGYHSSLPLSPWAKKRHLYLEKQVLSQASHIITTSPSTKKEFQSKTHQPITVITNGFDDESVVNSSPDSYFTFAHIGSLLSGRNPQMLWRVLSDLLEEDASFRSQFRLILAGKVGENTIDSLKELKLIPYTTLLGYVSHDKALELQQQAQILLLLEINIPQTQGIIPGKLFEYLAAKRYILALGHHSWDAADIIQELGVGIAPKYDNYRSIKEAVLQAFELYKQGKLSVKEVDIKSYHRENLTQKLSKIIYKKL